MKTSAQVKAYFQKQANILFDYFDKPRETFSENDYHSIRVAIKRIKALLDLLKKVDPRIHRKKYFTPYKVIFELAGKIRDQQVQLKLLTSYPLDPSIDKFERELTREIKSEKVKFFAMMTSSLIKDLQKSASKMKKYLDQADQKKIMHYLHNKIRIIQKLGNNKKLKISGVHGLRKKIKEIYYLQKMLEKKGQQIANTDQFQELLGKWHDDRVLMQGIKDFISSAPLSEKDKPVFEKLRQKIAGNNQQLYQSILRRKKAVLKQFK